MSVTVEYLSRAGWWAGHRSAELGDPVKYAQKVTAERMPCRVTDNDTGQVLWAPELAACPHCEDQHAGPFDGSCLL